jgi:hypothetical protein
MSTTRPTELSKEAFQPAKYLSTFAISGAKAETGSFAFDSGSPKYVWGKLPHLQCRVFTMSSKSASATFKGVTVLLAKLMTSLVAAVKLSSSRFRC